MIIRNAKKEDVENSRELLKGENIGWNNNTYDPAYYERLIDTEERSIFLVAEDNKEIVGVVFGEYSMKEDWSELMGVVVDENFRGKGIGVALMNKFEDIVRNKGISMIETDANINTLAKFIHKLGYEKGNTFVNCRKILKKED